MVGGRKGIDNSVSSDSSQSNPDVVYASPLYYALTLDIPTSYYFLQLQDLSLVPK